MEHLQLFKNSAHVIADNVASPGAPLLLWYVLQSKVWVSMRWALCEFLEPNHEDWMVLGVLEAYPNVCEPVSAPESLRILAWQTDHLRRRSEGLRPAEPPVGSLERMHFARYVIESYMKLGIEATPWLGIGFYHGQGIE